jgi:hypothetical protein
MLVLVLHITPCLLFIHVLRKEAIYAYHDVLAVLFGITYAFQLEDGAALERYLDVEEFPLFLGH